MKNPMIIPQIRPTMAAIGIEVAGCPKETPPTKMTASMPKGKCEGEVSLYFCISREGA